MEAFEDEADSFMSGYVRHMKIPRGEYRASVYMYMSGVNGRACLQAARGGDEPDPLGEWVRRSRPNEPFRIPRLSLRGDYQLDNIRLLQGDELLGYAEPRSAAILVTEVLVTRVESRALTLDEIRSYGIVVDPSRMQAFNFTFAFAVGGDVFDYEFPVAYVLPSPENPFGRVEALAFAIIVAKNMNGVTLPRPSMKLSKKLPALRLRYLKFGRL